MAPVTARAAPEAPGTSRSRRGLVEIVLVVGALILWRAALLAPATRSPDELRLVRARQHFDVLEFAPQFPGYPVAVVLAHLVPCRDDVLAWTVASLLAAAATSLVIALAVRRSAGTAEGIAAGASILLWPFLVARTSEIGTDTLVLPFLALSLVACTRARPRAAGVWMGLALGVRPSVLPFAVALLGLRERGRALGSCTLAIAVWLLPTAARVGADAYLHEGLRFVGGHFSRWGNTAFAATSSRGTALFEHWGLDPFRMHADAWLGGTTATLVCLLLCGLLGRSTLDVRRGRTIGVDRNLVPLLLGASSYAAWIAVAQNPQHSRHVLPLVVLGVALCAASVAKRGGRLGRVLLPALGLVLAAESSRLLVTRRASPVPALECARALEAMAASSQERFDPAEDRIYTGADGAFLHALHPEWSVRAVPSLRAMQEDLDSLPLSPRRVWYTSLVLAEGEDPTDPRVANFESADPSLDWGRRITLHQRDLPPNER